MSTTSRKVRVILHQNGLPYGTVRRAREGFAHALLLDQRGRPTDRLGKPKTWLVVDLYGVTEMATDDDVDDWPIVYRPVDDELWPHACIVPIEPDAARTREEQG